MREHSTILRAGLVYWPVVIHAQSTACCADLPSSGACVCMCDSFLLAAPHAPSYCSRHYLNYFCLLACAFSDGVAYHVGKGRAGK